MKKLNYRPFDDVSMQESRLLLEIIASTKEPLLYIYDIGVASGCSHYKHLIRLAEYVLLTKPGEAMLFLFDKRKTERTKKNFLECNLSKEQKDEINKMWTVLVEVLKTFRGESASRHEQFVFHFLLRLVKSFSNVNDIEVFHIEKKCLFDSYNTFILESKVIKLPTDGKSKNALLNKAHIPLVV